MLLLCWTSISFLYAKQDSVAYQKIFKALRCIEANMHSVAGLFYSSFQSKIIQICYDHGAHCHHFIFVKVTVTQEYPSSKTHISSCTVIKPWKSLCKRESTYELVHKMRHIPTHTHNNSSRIMQKKSNLHLTLHTSVCALQFTHTRTHIHITVHRWIFIIILFFIITTSKSMAKLQHTFAHKTI